MTRMRFKLLLSQFFLIKLCTVDAGINSYGVEAISQSECYDFHKSYTIDEITIDRSDINWKVSRYVKMETECNVKIPYNLKVTAAGPLRDSYLDYTGDYQFVEYYWRKPAYKKGNKWLFFYDTRNGAVRWYFSSQGPNQGDYDSTYDRLQGTVMKFNNPPVYGDNGFSEDTSTHHVLKYYYKSLADHVDCSCPNSKCSNHEVRTLPFDAILPITDVAIAYSESGGCNAEDTSQHTFMDSSLTFVDGDGTAQTIVITDNNGAAHLIEDWEVFPDSKSVLVNQFSGGTNFPPTQIIFTKITRNVCTCDNGIATTGDTCADGEVKCSSCYPNYLLSVDNLCTLFDSTALATLTTDRDTLQSNSDTLQNELNNMTTDRNNLQDYNRTLTRDRNTLHQEKNGLILQLETSESEKTILDSTITTLGNDKSDLENEKLVLEGTITTLENDKRILGNNKTKLLEDKSTLKSERDTCRSEKSQQLQDQTDALASCNSLKAVVEGARDALTSQLSSVTAVKDQCIQDKTQQLQDQIAVLVTCNTLKNESIADLASCKKEKSDCSDNKTKLLAENILLQERLIEAKKNISATNLLLTTANFELEKIQNELATEKAKNKNEDNESNESNESKKNNENNENNIQTNGDNIIPLVTAPSSSNEQTLMEKCDALLVERVGFDSSFLMIVGFGFFIYIIVLSLILILIGCKKLYNKDRVNRNEQTNEESGNVKIQPQNVKVTEQRRQARDRLVRKISNVPTMDNNDIESVPIQRASRRRSRAGEVKILRGGSNSVFNYSGDELEQERAKRASEHLM